MRIKEIVTVESLGQAYELNQKRTAHILGGMLWMRMSKINVTKAIDLSKLGLDQIEETDEEFSIGCMVTLRDLELHESLNQYSQGLLRKAVEDIVGVQFRNMATVGGSVYGRFGFSDVCTAFLVLDSYVEMYQGGIIPMAEFINKKKDNDILVRVIIRKEEGNFAYLSMRNTKTDFPVLAVAAAKCGTQVRVSVGARPARAKLVLADDLSPKSSQKLAKQFTYGSNMRASAQFREHVCKVLTSRAFKELREKEEV